MGRHIVVTGFGPFKGTSGKDNKVIVHDKNASWEAVKVLKEKWDNPEIELSVDEVEVSYGAVESNVDRIWEKDPLAVIHVGVAGSRKSIDLEIQSKNGVYDKKDVLGKIGCRDCKDGDVTVVEGPECLKTSINFMECLSSCPSDLPVNISDDPGNYLCGYIYYRSLLKCGSKPVLFIHVPIISVISPEDVARCLKAVELDSTFTIDKPKSNGPFRFSVDEYLLEDGSVMSFPIVHAIQTSMAQDTSLDHEYLPIAGLESFTKASMKLILGNTSPVVENRAVTIQTLSDVGGLRVAAEFLNKFLRLNVVSIPNTMPKEVHEVFESRGYVVHTIPYWNETKKIIDFEAIKYHLSVLNDGGLVLLENCGRNWSGEYLPESEWNEIIKIILEKNLFPILNAAQDGLCYTDLKNDHYPARKLADYGAEFIVTQSFDRSLGLYSERVGSMTLVVKERR